MEEPLLLPVTYQNKDLEFEFSLQRYGYIRRAGVKIGEVTVFFEPDEEGRYRAMVNSEQIEQSKSLSVGLLQAIAETLEQLR
ncbi:MAG: hypothetical protein JWP78_1563 [Mucilaginibacter sp.]|jgi:hypothetical protein|nr:hypothetical protein [Mucilaginibacter sp.]